MNFLKTLRLGVAISALPVVLISSTIGQNGAVLLYERNYSEAVSFSRTDAPLLRDFYVVLSDPDGNSKSRGKVMIAPLPTPSLGGKFSGSFIVDTTTLDRSRIALRTAALKNNSDTLELYVGRAGAADNPASDNTSFSKDTILATVDSLLPIRTLSFVRFDVKEWEVLDSVVSYDIDISFWGRPAENESENVAAVGG